MRLDCFMSRRSSLHDSSSLHALRGFSVYVMQVRAVIEARLSLAPGRCATLAAARARKAF